MFPAQTMRRPDSTNWRSVGDVKTAGVQICNPEKQSKQAGPTSWKAAATQVMPVHQIVTGSPGYIGMG